MSLQMTRGWSEFRRKLGDAAKKLPHHKDKFLMQEGELLRGYAANNTPVDTGTLRNAWKRTNPDGDSIRVYNNTEYANHVEWGHRTGKDKKGFVPGRYMLRRGMKNAMDNFEEDTKDIVEGIFND